MSGEVDGTNSVTFSPRGVLGVVSSSVASSPQELVGRSLRPRNHWKVFQPLFDRNSQDVRVKRSLAQAEDGLDVPIDVDFPAGSDSVKREVVWMRTEVGLGFDVGHEALSGRFEAVVFLVRVSGIGGVRTSHSPALHGRVELFKGIGV